eukprot:659621-Hanusia_phi.AAC.1
MAALAPGLSAGHSAPVRQEADSEPEAQVCGKLPGPIGSAADRVTVAACQAGTSEDSRESGPGPAGRPYRTVPRPTVSTPAAGRRAESGRGRGRPRTTVRYPGAGDPAGRCHGDRRASGPRAGPGWYRLSTVPRLAIRAEFLSGGCRVPRTGASSLGLQVTRLS